MRRGEPSDHRAARLKVFQALCHKFLQAKVTFNSCERQANHCKSASTRTMLVFVTGATGFIGSTVVLLLRRAGHEVIAFARNKEKADAIRAEGVEVVLGDLRQTDLLAETASRADATVRTAEILCLGPRTFLRAVRGMSTACIPDLLCLRQFALAPAGGASDEQ